MAAYEEEEVYKDLPYYKQILKTFFKKQILRLLEELADQTGEEAIILTANVNNGTMSHLGTSNGRGFIEGRDDIKTQFLSYCLKSHHDNRPGEGDLDLLNTQHHISKLSTSRGTKRPRLGISSATSTFHRDILEDQTRAPIQQVNFNATSSSITNPDLSDSSVNKKHTSDADGGTYQSEQQQSDQAVGGTENDSSSNVSASYFDAQHLTGDSQNVDSKGDGEAGDDVKTNTDSPIIKIEPITEGFDESGDASFGTSNNSFSLGDSSWKPQHHFGIGPSSTSPGALTIFPGGSTYKPYRRQQKHRVNLSLKEKVQLILEHNKMPGMSQRKLGQKFNVGKTAVGQILRNKYLYLQQYELIGDSPRKRFNTSCKYADINNVVWQWYKTAKENGEPISGPIIQEKALEFAKELDINDFKASNGWLHSWKSRYSVSSSYKDNDATVANHDKETFNRMVDDVATANLALDLYFGSDLNNVSSDSNIKDMEQSGMTASEGMDNESFEKTSEDAAGAEDSVVNSEEEVNSQNVEIKVEAFENMV